MALVFCPECNKKISEHAETCPDCGFPIKNFIKENNFTDFSKAFICPKCAESYEEDIFPFQFKCEYCHTLLVQTDIDRKELRSLGILKINEEKYRNKTVSLAKQFGENQFDETIYKSRLKKLNQDFEKSKNKPYSFEKPRINQNRPKCPTCQSTKIRKISATRRAVGALGFGLLSKTAKSQFECMNCGYKW